jgi:hypothetical protein
MGTSFLLGETMKNNSIGIEMVLLFFARTMIFYRISPIFINYEVSSIGRHCTCYAL